ncbi:TIA1 cytotoxic granule-associated RNA binding protein [Gracilaria domingensis]|nr:TIA1 cytotoxic granule-associated RNA binding protein [Gracilaria domingensis]
MATPALAAQTSLFVGNLDPRVYRQLLHEVFSLAGPVTQCHVVFDKNTGVSSGFGFVDYADHATAQAAMEKFRGRSMYGKLLTIDWARPTGPAAESAAQHCLFVGNLSSDVTDEQLVSAFSQFGEVTSAKCAKDPITGKTQGFAFVSFKEKNEAHSAMDSMNGQVLNNRPLRVDWAKGKNNDDDHEKRTTFETILAQTSVNNVTAYVSGLSVNTSEQAIRSVFEAYGAIREVRIPESIKMQASETMYAFVRYFEHTSAARAIFECQGGTQVEGRNVQVHWGRENARRAPMQPHRSGYQQHYSGGFYQGGPSHGGGYHQSYNQRPPYGGHSYGRAPPPSHPSASQHRYRPY